MLTSTTLALALATSAAPAPPDPSDVKECVAKGLKWLAEQQDEKGNWFGRANTAPTTTTATAGLALLMEGSTLRTGTHAARLRKAVEWMEQVAATDGGLIGTNPTDAARPINTHAHAVLFLACAADVDDDPVRRARLGRILDRAIAFAAAAQTARGGWGVRAARDGIGGDDPLTTVTVLHALLTARKAGFEVPPGTTTKATSYLVRATTSVGSVYLPDVQSEPPSGGLVHFTAGAVAALLTQDASRPAAFGRWLRNLHTGPRPPWPARANLVGMAAQLSLARVAFGLGERGHGTHDPDAKGADRITWYGHRAAVFPSIRSAQAADGSWPDTIPGPVYGSAVALVILQMENDYLPAFSR